jgi:hypothetical protein
MIIKIMQKFIKNTENNKIIDKPIIDSTRHVINPLIGTISSSVFEYIFDCSHG